MIPSDLRERGGWVSALAAGEARAEAPSVMVQAREPAAKKRWVVMSCQLQEEGGLLLRKTEAWLSWQGQPRSLAWTERHHLSPVMSSWGQIRVAHGCRHCCCCCQQHRLLPAAGCTLEKEFGKIKLWPERTVKAVGTSSKRSMAKRKKCRALSMQESCKASFYINK